MKRIPHRRLFLLLACLAAGAGALLLDRGSNAVGEVAYDDLVGNETCLSCHGEKEAFNGTAHHRTSSLPTRNSIAASFEAGENTLRSANPYLHYRMEARADGFHQTAVMGVSPDTVTLSERLGLVIGSGRKGQTYLYWRNGGQLFQLPVSYWTQLEGWAHSPGYRSDVPDFGRAVAPRCLECHATYFQPAVNATAENTYDREAQVLGITCEKCHGPGRTHVSRQRSPLHRLLGRAIVNPADLPRERQVELCALCHGGIGEARAPAFSYRPGEPLSDYLHLPPADSGKGVDVHGNQVALLRKSSCFRSSSMTCSTCHDVHRTERSPAALSARCLSCHQTESCGAYPERGAEISNGCVDCHMPELPSKVIVSVHQGRTVQPRVRTHWIRSYSDDEIHKAERTGGDR